MKILISQYAASSPSPIASFDLSSPGGTLGRSPGNDLLLPDTDKKTGRIQAVVRFDGSACRLANISSMGEVHINGVPLLMSQEAAITEQDDIAIGSYRLTLAHADDEETAQAPLDVFSDLLNGPGVLPIGSVSDTSHSHPFDMDSSIARNHPDPLQALHSENTQPFGQTGGLPDFNTLPEEQSEHILSNTTPSTLNLHDPLAPHRNNDIDDALSQGRAELKN